MSLRLPPKFVNIPVPVVYSDLPAPIRETLIQILGLTWESKFRETPPITYEELSKILGKSHSTIYEHVRYLRSHSWLLSRSAGGSAYIFSFVDRSGTLDSLEKPDTFSEKPESLINLISEDINQKIYSDEEINNNPKKRKTTRTLISSRKDQDPNYSHPAVIAYRSLTHITPNAVQMKAIVNTVKDQDLWSLTIEHWLEHGWKPTNVIGMINSYLSGGRAGCTLCNCSVKGKSPSKGKVTASDIDDIFREIRNGD